MQRKNKTLSVGQQRFQERQALELAWFIVTTEKFKNSKQVGKRPREEDHKASHECARQCFLTGDKPASAATTPKLADLAEKAVANKDKQGQGVRQADKHGEKKKEKKKTKDVSTPTSVPNYAMRVLQRERLLS